VDRAHCMRFVAPYEVTTKEDVWGEGNSDSALMQGCEGCSRWCKPIECTDFDLTIREGTYIVEGFASSVVVLRRRLG
jgi:hypothetical protein